MYQLGTVITSKHQEISDILEVSEKFGGDINRPLRRSYTQGRYS